MEVPSSKKQRRILFGNRIPKDYFITSGIGESDVTDHAGSWDFALHDAGIQDYNYLIYSSIMPRESVRVEPPKTYDHGAVAEVIMASRTGECGERLTAGLIIGWIKDKKTGARVGGLVAEYKGNDHEDVARANLTQAITEMFHKRCSHLEHELVGKEVFMRSFVPKKRYGSVIVSIVFTSYEVPVLGEA